MRPVIFCCTAHSLLSRFPSRAKRIDVISRVIFPMVFAVYNLADASLLFQKKRTETRNSIRDSEEYRPTTTTPYPHPHPQSPDLGGFMQSSSSMSDPYMLSGNIAEVHGGGCEIHMNSFPSSGAAMGIAPAGGAIPLHYGQGQKLPYGLNWLRPVILCCTAHSLLSRFPSRAKRIDVISRVIFPMVFAVFNLAYWLYYLFAKSKSPQQED